VLDKKRAVVTVWFSILVDAVLNAPELIALAKLLPDASCRTACRSKSAPRKPVPAPESVTEKAFPLENMMPLWPVLQQSGLHAVVP